MPYDSDPKPPPPKPPPPKGVPSPMREDGVDGRAIVAHVRLPRVHSPSLGCKDRRGHAPALAPALASVSNQGGPLARCSCESPFKARKTGEPLSAKTMEAILEVSRGQRGGLLLSRRRCLWRENLE